MPRETLDLFCGFYSGDPFDHFYANEFPKTDIKMTNMAGETIPAVRFEPMAYVGSPYNFHYRVSPDQLTEGLIIPKLQISESRL